MILTAVALSMELFHADNLYSTISPFSAFIILLYAVSVASFCFFVSITALGGTKLNLKERYESLSFIFPLLFASYLSRKLIPLCALTTVEE